ncbi:MAG: zinc metalloprotease HtpX [Legionellaceae bacterium]|nr:zinc metalloprotease HtpX [Legionellaceae bacterium]
MNDFKPRSIDWRKNIKENERKTTLVVVIFLGIFLLVGLLSDIVFGMAHYHMPSEAVFQALLSFRIFPMITCIMIVIAGMSLLVTYRFYDKIMLLGTNSHEVTSENAQNHEEKQLYNVVEEMKVAAGMNFMPKVYLIQAQYMNAFASGYSEKSAMVAITSGLVQKLNRSELQAVMAHELTHIRHHDIKLTLTVSVLGNIILIAIDWLFYSILFKGDSNQNSRGRSASNKLFLVVMILRFVLPLITGMLTLFLSRTREYMADSGAVQLMRDNEPLAHALLKISKDHTENQTQYATEYGQTAHESVRRASYIFEPKRFNGDNYFSDMFTTHPSLEKRLQALGFKTRASGSK